MINSRSCEIYSTILVPHASTILSGRCSTNFCDRCLRVISIVLWDNCTSQHKTSLTSKHRYAHIRGLKGWKYHKPFKWLLLLNQYILVSVLALWVHRKEKRNSKLWYRLKEISDSSKFSRVFNFTRKYAVCQHFDTSCTIIKNKDYMTKVSNI